VKLNFNDIFVCSITIQKKGAPEANPVGNDCCNILQNRIQFINSNADYSTADIDIVRVKRAGDSAVDRHL